MRTRLLTPTRSAVLLVVLALSNAASASAQTSAGGMAGFGRPSVARESVPAQSLVKAKGSPRRRTAAIHIHQRRRGGSTGVESVNSRSLSGPSAGAYVNATLYYDYEPGRLYIVNTSPRFLTAITLRPGEKLISKAAGDTVRWVLGETVQGSGPSEQVVVFVKPIRGDLKTNIILTTDQRSYLLEAISREGDAFTSVVSWTYPQEQMREQLAARAAATQTVASATSVENLNFGYRVEPVHARRGPSWQPLRVFDDGLKTYIQFPAALAATEAPPLFLIGAHNQAQLVNYRLMGGYYVVDRLLGVAELRLGEKPQAIVRITRIGQRG